MLQPLFSTSHKHLCLSFTLFHSSVWGIAIIQVQVCHGKGQHWCLLPCLQNCFCFYVLCHADVLPMVTKKQVWCFSTKRELILIVLNFQYLVKMGLYKQVKWLEAVLWQGSQLCGQSLLVNKNWKKRKDGCPGAVLKCISYSADPVRLLQLL